MQKQQTLNSYLSQAIRDNWQRMSLKDFQGAEYKYSDVAREIARLHLLFERSGIRRGDRVSLCARNSSAWSIAALATLTYGAVAVPILHDFHPDTVHHLVNHSEARLLFTDSHTMPHLDVEAMPGLDGIILVGDFALAVSRSEALTEAHANLDALFDAEYPEGITPEAIHYAEVPAGDVVLINYTSGSTGFSKGVMLTEHNLWSNLQFCIDGLTFLVPGDRMICMLPLAHMFGFMVEMVHCFVKGCEINFITRTPSPKIILGAFAEVRPKLIIAVPLIIEKIIKTRIFPMLATPKMRVLMAIPGVRGIILKKIRQKLLDAFGGQVLEIILGGAALNHDVETFLRRIHFPVTIGYGMTECGPLISYCPWQYQRPGSCGRPADRMQVRVDSHDPTRVPGVLWVRGDNVMKGYYKNEEATEATLGEGGWMNTGDICTVDADGYIYIRGRDKNMILGPSGQNIYPEEIEQQLNNLPYVAESIVIDSGEGHLKALVHPDYDAAAKDGLDDEAVVAKMAENIKTLNAGLAAYSRVKDHEIYREEFEKTPKRSIKRYLYQK